MDEYEDSSYDENDIQDFEEYLGYYGFHECTIHDDISDEDIDSDSVSDDHTDDIDINELYF